MKKILIIEESTLFREYLVKRLGEEKDLEVVQALNGLDGALKIRNEIPDLIIMDYYLSRKSSLDVLEEKITNPNTKGIPIILLSTSLAKDNLKQLSKYGIKKFFIKPLKMDVLLNAINEIADIKVEVDKTPCLIEAHFNEDILFVEIAQGLNTEKLVLLKYKITELLDMYKIKRPKVLLMLSALELNEKDVSKLNLLFKTIIKEAQPNSKLIKVLSKSKEIVKYIEENKEYKNILVTDNLENAMDDLVGVKADPNAHDKVVSEKILNKDASTADKDSAVDLKFDNEQIDIESKAKEIKDSTIAVVDDDFVIRTMVKTVFEEFGIKVLEYEDGKHFMLNVQSEKIDLVFLDLMMPKLNGFQVLQSLKKLKIKVPVIVFSALSQKETIVKAMELGTKTYLRKPLKPEELVNKAVAVLNRNF